MEHTGVTGFSAIAISFSFLLKQISFRNLERCGLSWPHPFVGVTQISGSVSSTLRYCFNACSTEMLTGAISS